MPDDLPTTLIFRDTTMALSLEHGRWMVTLIHGPLHIEQEVSSKTAERLIAHWKVDAARRREQEQSWQIPYPGDTADSEDD